MPPISRRSLYYALPFIGDFNNSLLNIIFILFGVQIGLSTDEIGWIVTSFGLAYLVSSPLIGLFSDKITRKRSILIATIGQTLISCFYLGFFGLKHSNDSYLLIIVIGQICRAVIYAFYWPAIEAYLSEMSGNHIQQHQKKIGYFCISWSIGAAVGSNLGGFFAETNLFMALIFVILIYFTGIIITLLSMPKPSLSPDSITTSHSSHIPLGTEDHLHLAYDSNLSQHDLESSYSLSVSPSSSLNSRTLKKITWILLLGTFYFAISCNGIMSYFPNYASLPRGLNLNETIIGQLVFLFGIGRFIAFLLQEKLPITIPFLLISLVLSSILLLFYSHLDNLLFLGILLTINGFFAGRIYYNSLELTLKYEHYAKGAKAGLFESIVGLGSGITPLASGFIAKINLVYPFYFFGSFGLFIALLAIVIYYQIKKKIR